MTDSPAAVPAAVPAVGQPAPAFTLPDAAGDPVALADLRGRWVVLYFYPRDDTPGCTTEAKDFTALLPEFLALDAVVLGVSKDSPASHAAFAGKHGLGVRLLADESMLALQAYGAWREKNMYGKTTMGVVRSTFFVDPAGTVAASWPKVAKAEGHAQKVLEKLRKLLD